MQQVTLDDAVARLPQLIREAQSMGEDILITENAQPVARLTPMSPPVTRPQFGSARGLIQIADDFDAPLEDFREYEQ